MGKVSRVLSVLAVSTLAVSASAQSLSKGASVRVQSSGLGSEWYEGTIGVSPAGCTMINLKKKAPGNYTAVSLAGANKLQELRGGGWIDVAVKPLLAKEPKDCREGDND